MGRRMSEACQLADLKWQKTIEDFGWITYLTSKIEVFDGLVKVFYTNAMKVSDECFSTYIMGRYYEIKRGTLVVASGIPDDGEEYNAYKSHKTLSFAKKVLEKRNLKVVPRYAKVLKMHDRLLHLIVTDILTPLSTSYSIIQSLMFTVLKVDTSCDLPIMHQSMTVIGKRSMHSYGYRQNKNGEWVKKEDIGSDSECEAEMDFEEMKSSDEDGMNVEGGESSIAELAATIDDVKGRVYNVEKQTKKILDLLLQCMRDEEPVLQEVSDMRL
ncbi:hypothetical protein PTKIN_Ptkin15bG0062300 [Pterospermum kingtungense]